MVATALAMATTSCIDLNIPSGEGLFPAASFIVSGTMEVDPRGPECSIFHADNGFRYHLFQGPRLTNDEYDQLFEDGSRCRLEIQVRKDLTLTCAVGARAEIIEVLEFIPASQVD
jgi:hypothetical protein